jgi:Putative porin
MNTFWRDHRSPKTTKKTLNEWIVGSLGVLAATLMTNGACAQTSDPLINLMIKKGILTEQEAEQVKAESQTSETNRPAFPESKWKIDDAIKSVELFGDIRFRYEYRSARTPGGGGIILDRYRYALRLGLRGEVADNFYYGTRLETASNPRSPWVTFGTSSSGSTPFQGPFGKSTAGINLGQAYLGWKPGDWLDVTVGKMPNPLYTTSMVWDSDLSPEGLAERFKYSVGQADLFATFGQFLYEDTNPNSSSVGLASNFPFGNSSSTPFLLTWQGGFIYHIDKDVSFKVAATLYNYTSHGEDVSSGTTLQSPGFAGIFVGQGAAAGASYSATGGNFSAPPGFSGFPLGSANGFNFNGFAANQTGINDLLIVEIPAEVDFKIAKLNARVFGDFAENLDGGSRAINAAAAASLLGAGVQQIGNPATEEDKAYQIGVAIGNRDDLGLVYGSKARKGMWEARAYWQHVEQYALDPNLLDSDFFEGRGNLQGVYTAFAYSFADNMIGTVRYGYASPIDRRLGTGGSNQDIPQVSPINTYQLIQLDLTCRF